MVAASRQRNESRSWSYGTRQVTVEEVKRSVGMRVPRRRQLSQSAPVRRSSVRKVAQNRNPCLEQMCHSTRMAGAFARALTSRRFEWNRKAAISFDRPRGHGPKSRPEHERPRIQVAVFNRTVSKVDEFINNQAKGTKVIGTGSIQEMCRLLKTRAA